MDTKKSENDAIAQSIYRALVRARIRAAQDAAFAGTRLVTLRKGKLVRLAPNQVIRDQAVKRS